MKKLIFISLIAFGGVALTGCNTDENSIDDYPLNYEITEVKATRDIPVGAMIANCANDISDETRWTRLTEEYDQAAGLLGPNVMPTAGQYSFMGTDSDEHDAYSIQIGRMLKEMQTAGIDFAITPPVRMHNDAFPRNLNSEDSIFINMISGRTDTLTWKNNGEHKYAIMINMQNTASQLGNSSVNSPLEGVTTISTYDVKGEDGKALKDEDGNTVQISFTQEERLEWFFRRIAQYFKDDTYYKINGNRPVLVFQEPEKFFAEDILNYYDKIRNACKEVSGMDPFIICNYEQWTVVPRYTYLFLNGKPDAVVPRAMTYIGMGKYELKYIFDVAVNENYKYSREYLASRQPETIFIPSISAGYSWYVRDGRVNDPFINPNAETLSHMSWIAKMNLNAATPLVILDSYNNWGYGNAVESTDPNYGKGYGDELLKVIKKEFKVN